MIITPKNGVLMVSTHSPTNWSEIYSKFLTVQDWVVNAGIGECRGSA